MRAAVSGRPLVVGVCGAQGSGKSTLAAQASRRLAEIGVTAAVLALDDFYMTKADRLRLAVDVHPLLAVRGPPGTHDIAALRDAVCALREGRAVSAPTFDKLVDDRASAASDRLIPPADVILLEGWCIGAEPEHAAELAAAINELERREDSQVVWRTYVNDALAGDYRRLFQLLDGLIFLKAPHFDVVARWRLQQEEGARSRAPAARQMSASEVADFVRHYERITRRMLAAPPRAADLILELDEDRHVREVISQPRNA